MSTPAPPHRRGPALFAIGLALAGITMSIVLMRSHLTVFEGDVAGGLLCGGVGGRFDCDTVAAHPSSWLLGLPLPFWGIVFYVAAASLALLAWRLPEGEASAAARAGAVLAVTAVILDVWLGWIMVRQIGAICLNCVSTYVLNLGLLAAFWRLDRGFTIVREWPALLARWRAARPGRTLKIVTTIVAIGGASAAFAYTQGAVNELLTDSQDEAAQLLRKFDTEPPLDMARFEGLPAEGPAGARVTIVVASDFECSFCRNLAARLEELRAEYPNDVRILFLNAPISPKCNPRVTREFHEHACWLARAGVCAARQGRFWQYHDLVYRDLAPASVDERGVRRALARAGIDPAALDSCLEGAEADSVVAREVRLWRELKMDSVPSIVINGHVKTRGIYPNALRTVVRTLLARPA